MVLPSVVDTVEEGLLVFVNNVEGESANNVTATYRGPLSKKIPNGGY